MKSLQLSKHSLQNPIDHLVTKSLRLLNRYVLEKFLPVKFNGKNVGFINEDNYRLLSSKGFLKEKIQIDDILSKNNFFFDEVFEYLIKSGFLKTNLREKCPVFDQESTNPRVNFSHYSKFGSDQIFSVERALLSTFGFPAYGVHMNGWKLENKKFIFLMAKRSQSVLNFKGLYDNLVGGGQPSKISIVGNLEKESFEEANLKRNHLSNVEFSSVIRYMHTFKKKFSPSIIFSYNLQLDDDSVIKNNDGEIESFHYFSVDEIFSLLKNEMIKPNCILPIIDFLLKYQKKIFSSKTIREIEKLI